MVLLGGLASAANFTPLLPLPVRIIASSPAYAGNRFDVTNLISTVPRGEYASNDAGTNTEVIFDFGAPVTVTAFRHVDRNDAATIAASELDFLDADGRAVAAVPVSHVNRRGGETFYVLPSPVTARRVKWHVTQLGHRGATAVGGTGLVFYTSAAGDDTPRRDRIALRFFPCRQKNGGQPVEITVAHDYEEPAEVRVVVPGVRPAALHLKRGSNTLNLTVPVAQSATNLPVSVQFDGHTVVAARFVQNPVRPLTVYVLPMSHTDIGYALSQSASEDRQITNLMQGIAAAQRTAAYPPGARFVWNVEVLWAADMFLHRMDDRQRADFLEAVRQGQVELNGSYANELTGLCRPEELIQLFRSATRLAAETGVPIQSAMISDVPGYTWGTVNAMAQAGIKYFSAAPNYFDRIGTIFRDCEDQPFYWVAPDGQTKVLTWIPFRGYALSHIYQQMSLKLIGDLGDSLDRGKYPYDITYIRWAGHNDNAAPDPAICDFVKDWNARYVWPHFIISGTTEAFHAFETRYGDKLPRRQGDWTPYWEDGAASSAWETAENRNNADRLTQADALWAMIAPQAYPTADFETAWRNVLLYSEHTWGADVSVRQADSQKTTSQWAVKKAYADDADAQSRKLLNDATVALAPAGNGENPRTNLVDVVNTLSWAHGGLIKVSPQLSSAGDRVLDERGHPAISQRLVSGELAFWADDVPPFAARRYQITAGPAYAGNHPVTVHGAVLDNGLVHVAVDDQNGGIKELTGRGWKGNLVDTTGGQELDQYLYLPGDNLQDLEGNDPVTISAWDKGPLVASLVIDSDAPGCYRLSREVQLVAGQDYVELMNLVDKARLQAKDYLATKESVNFAFPFNVPQGRMRLNLPLAGSMCPQTDQLPGSCKNWFTVGRWVDVANADQGVTWVTLDAPLIEVGGITANLLNSQTNPEVWRQKVGDTQTFYSWVMNNHWSSNYRAYQDGITVFRYVLHPYRHSDPAAATRFATAFSQPLLVVPALDDKLLSVPLLTVSSPDVLVLDLKPSDDRKAWIVRLFNAAAKDRSVKLHWRSPVPQAVYMSDTSEQAGEKVGRTITVPGNGLTVLRVERE